MAHTSQIIGLLIGIMILYSCNSEKKSHLEKNKFYYLFSSHKNSNKDSLQLIEIPKHSEVDSLIYRCDFESNKGEHVIQMFINPQHLVCDGGYVIYELDNLGIIYTRSTSWNKFKILESNNDSINKLISFALGKIISEPNLRDYHLTFSERTVQFSPPIISR
ncbi:MAG: hypothetical protein ACK5B9_07565 [Flavobacteriia bacterium]|jgi:hypothetical protein